LEESRQLLGVGQARNRTPTAVQRTVPFGLLCVSLVVCWYATHGQPALDVAAHRARAPWYRHKHAVSFADMLTALQRAMRLPRFSGGRVTWFRRRSQPPSSRPSGSVSRPSAGPPHARARPPRPTGGPGWCWPATPSCAWPASSPPTHGCRGSGPALPASCPLPGAAGVSAAAACARLAGQRAETRRALPRPPQGQPSGTCRALPGDQEARQETPQQADQDGEGRLTGHSGHHPAADHSNGQPSTPEGSNHKLRVAEELGDVLHVLYAWPPSPAMAKPRASAPAPARPASEARSRAELSGTTTSRPAREAHRQPRPARRPTPPSATSKSAPSSGEQWRERRRSSPLLTGEPSSPN
jgi:hypothetical protein